MAIRTREFRSIAPLIVGAALALIGFVPRQAATAVLIERVQVDPARDAPHVLESLEGLGAGVARRIVGARRALAGIDSPEDLMTIPGVGTRLLHRWHLELAFQGEIP